MTEELAELAARVLLVCVAVTWLVILWRADQNPALQRWSILKLITTKDGDPDRVAVGEMTVLLSMTSWGTVMVLRDRLSEWFIGAYVFAFVLRGAHAAYLKATHPQLPGSTSTTSTTATTTSTATAAPATADKEIK